MLQNVSRFDTVLLTKALQPFGSMGWSGFCPLGGGVVLAFLVKVLQPFGGMGFGAFLTLAVEMAFAVHIVRSLLC